MRLICINGWSASAALLKGFTECLSKTHEVIVLDHLYQYAWDEVRARLDSLIEKDTVLMGWSLGGMLALRYVQESLTAQHRLKALVLLQVPPCFMQKTDWPSGVSAEAFESLQGIVEERKAIKLARHFSQLMIAGSDDVSTERKIVKAQYHEENLPDWPVLSTGLNLLKTLDLRDSPATLSLPIFGLYGEKDALISPEVSGYFREHYLRFKAVSLPGMGHFPFGRHVQAVARKIDDFLLETADESYS